MARVGKGELRRYPKVFQPVGVSMPELSVYRTAIYVSASRWGTPDDEKRKSTEEQLLECRKYISAHDNLQEIITYVNQTEEVDSAEAKSEWHHLLDDAECRNFDAVLVLNLQNIDESCAIASFFIGRFFYPAGIRFISVEDGFDSKTNDMQEYLIHKTREYISFVGEKRHIDRFRDGRINRNNVPYGYIYDPERQPSIFPDSETESYIRKIFELQCEGRNPVEIVRAMNEAGAPVPSQRRSELYGTQAVDSTFWKSTMVKNILCNPIYTGDYVTGRTKERSIDGVTTARKAESDEWLVLRHHHEPLISKETYEQAQKMAAARKFAVNRDMNLTQNSLRAVLCCAHCGSFLSRSLAGTLHALNENETVYYCDSSRYHPEHGCKLYTVPEDIILSQIRSAFVREIKKAQQFANRRVSLMESETYQEWFREIGKDRPHLHEELRMTISNGKEADDYYRRLNTITERENAFVALFSEENPWLQMFVGLDIVRLPELTKGNVKKYISGVVVSRDGTAVIHFKQENYQLELQQYHERLTRAGEEGLWAEETEQ